MAYVNLLLTEASLGCLMMVLDTPDAVQILEWTEKNIPQQFLDIQGIEREVHITAQYGFNPDVTVEEIQDAIAGFGAFPVTLRSLSRFTCKGYDVLKVNIEGESLLEFHALIQKKFKGRLTETHPEYVPHLTLCYLKPGALTELDGTDPFNGSVYIFDDCVYSTPESTKKSILSLVDNDDD